MHDAVQRQIVIGAVAHYQPVRGKRAITMSEVGAPPVAASCDTAIALTIKHAQDQFELLER